MYIYICIQKAIQIRFSQFESKHAFEFLITHSELDAVTSIKFSIYRM